MNNTSHCKSYIINLFLSILFLITPIEALQLKDFQRETRDIKLPSVQNDVGLWFNHDESEKGTINVQVRVTGDKVILAINSPVSEMVLNLNEKDCRQRFLNKFLKSFHY